MVPLSIPTGQPRADKLAALRGEIACVQETRGSVLAFGVANLDERLAEGGLNSAGLHELAAATSALSDDAAATLFAAGIAARFAKAPGASVLWAVTRFDLYAPGLEQVGLSPERVFYAQARKDSEVLALSEDGLRDGSLACVIAEVKAADQTATRRLQLAAADGGTPMLLYRRHRSRTRCPLESPSLAMTRWRIGCASSAALPYCSGNDCFFHPASGVELSPVAFETEFGHLSPAEKGLFRKFIISHGLITVVQGRIYRPGQPQGVITVDDRDWFNDYKWNKRRVELGLGSAGPVSLAEARAKADEAARLRAQGIDPKQHWRAVSVAAVDNTFGTVATEFIAGRKAGWKNAKHTQQWENTLKTYAKAIWNKSVSDISVDDIVSILLPIWTEKSETAQRVRGRIETILDAAKVRGLRSGENPAQWRGNLALLLPKQRKGPKKHHAAMPHADVPTLMGKLTKANGLAARALELLVHTAARTSEVLNATRDEFDLEQGIWTVPAERMKAGKKHRVPLSEQALALIATLPRRGDYLFAGARKEKPLSNMSMAMVLRRMGLDEFTVHGFRSSFRDWAADVANAPREIAEQALAHQVGDETERAYRRGDALEQRRTLMTEWSKYIAKGE